MKDNQSIRRQLLVCLRSFLERLSEDDALYEDLDWFVESLSEGTGDGVELYDAEALYSDGVYRE